MKSKQEKAAKPPCELPVVQPLEKNKRVGRPTKRSPALAARICVLIAQKNTAVQACEKAQCSEAFLYLWLHQDEEFMESFARAHAIRAFGVMEEVLEIADDDRFDTKIINVRGEDVEVENKEWIGRCTLRVNTRMKLMGLWNRSKFGDKLQHSNDPENPLPQPAANFIVVPAKYSYPEDDLPQLSLPPPQDAPPRRGGDGR